MRIVRHLLLAVMYGISGALIVGIAFYVDYLESRPDLRPWHLAELDAEFTADDSHQVNSLADYLALEDRLFGQLRTEVYAQTTAADARLLNRYYEGSLADPLAYERDWNRSFELAHKSPRGAVLLLHGLSDSPYSMRALAQLLHARGYHVVALRLPGHGTAPSGLVHARWEDFAAATRLAARDIRARFKAPLSFYMVGYSTGAARAVEYSLAKLEGEDLPAADGLILLSPAIGVSPVAALAKWQARLGGLLGLEKLAWQSILPEYIPHKYNSFAVNAGDQIYQLTQIIAARITRLDTGQGVTGMPPLLAFQSVADATVSSKALARVLMRRLAPGGHELVLFDINRHAEVEALLAHDPRAQLAALLSDVTLPFALTLVTNDDSQSETVGVRHKPATTDDVLDEPLGLQWPRGVYSLSHTALPFAPNDPIFGSAEPEQRKGIYLGRIELRGEKGLLLIPASDQVRLSHNPFFPYVERRVGSFVH
ncbi:MAG: alpha/beta fold hydrolase [Pseudomonadota bacterium]|nr:MAG: alpha/beta fold hydrolase [Pseudomonadota bacterium]